MDNPAKFFTMANAPPKTSNFNYASSAASTTVNGASHMKKNSSISQRGIPM